MVPDIFVSDVIDGNRIRTMNHTLELIPHLSPETGPVEFTRSDSLVAQIPLELDNITNSLLLNGLQTSLLLRDTGIADLLAHRKQVVGTQQGTHMFGPEGRGTV